MSERKFIKNLTKPGSAAVLRENVSLAVRHSTLMVRLPIPEPIDYENFVSKNREILLNDPQRELVLFPMNDFTVKKISNFLRTTKVHREINDLSNLDSLPLHVQECIKSFKQDFCVITFQYSFFSGSYLELPKFCKVNDQNNLTDQIYEQDDDDLNATNNNNDADFYEYNSTVGIIKESYVLYETNNDSFISIATKSFKRRWMSLRQEIDGTLMLDFHRDKSKMEAKFSICLDFCNQLVKNSKRVKFAFELKMTEGHKTCVLAAENESDYDSWIDVLSKAISNKNLESLNRKNIILSSDSDLSSPAKNSMSTSTLLPKFGTLRNLELLKKNPELNKLQPENDYIITQQRKEGRKNICTIFPDLYQRKGSFLNLALNSDCQPSPLNENFGYRFKFTCTDIHFNLKTTIDGKPGLVEPLFISVAIYDIRRGKLTEEFRFDINDAAVKEMLPADDQEDVSIESKEQIEFTDKWILNPKSAIFSVHEPNSDMYLVIRIEKIFSGGITSTSEVYLKSVQNGGFGKLGNKLHKSTKATCQKMNKTIYRMPFAWSAKPLFKNSSSTANLDLKTEFGPIYRQDSSKLSDEDLIKHLIELKNTEKLKNITSIPGKIKIKLEDYSLLEKVPSKNDLNYSTSKNLRKTNSIHSSDSSCEGNSQEATASNIVNSSHVPVVPFKLPIAEPAIVEIQEFLTKNPSTSYPFTNFTNLLYVFPKFLKYDAQKLFLKAKNICCVVEFRDSDAENAVPLRCIFGSAVRESREFVRRVKTAVTHHNNNPLFYEEIKLFLPVVLNEKQHLLFSFYHVSSSSLSNKKKEVSNIDTPIGYAWVPIYPKGRLLIDEVTLPISTHLPPGYLSYKPLGLGQGYSGPEIKWIDSGKEAFRVGFKLVSSLFPTDPQLHQFFVQCDKMLDIKSNNEEFLDNSSNFDSVSLASEKQESKRMSMCSEAGREISKFVQIQHSMPKMLTNLQKCDICDQIRFFPRLINQLLKLLIATTSTDVAQWIVKTIICVIDSLENVNKGNVVKNYLEFLFTNDLFADLPTKTNLHEELIVALVNTLRSSSSDFALINKLLAHSSFFFRICVKSMVCHLLDSNRIKMHRHERFSTEFHDYLTQFVDFFMPEIMKNYNALPKETKSANRALSHFLRCLFSFMDRGFVFRLIKLYLDKFHAAKDSLPLHSYKFEFLAIITSYEHYIALNLPVNFSQFIKSPTYEINFMDDSMSINDEFCKNHFLIGVLLQELRAALAEVSQVRTLAISVLRNLLVKHSIDERYQSKFQQTRISTLYFPFISLLLENIYRIQVSGFSNSFLSPSSNNSATNTIASSVTFRDKTNSLGGLQSLNGSMYSLNTIASGTGTVSSKSNLYNSKRVPFTDKFNSLNTESSKQMVQSLRRNSSLESTLNKADSVYLNNLSPMLENSFNNKKSLNDLFEPIKHSQTNSTANEPDDCLENLMENKTIIENESQSTSPFSHSSASSTTTLTANRLLGSRVDLHSLAETLAIQFQLPPIHKNIPHHQAHQRTHSIPIRFDKLNTKEVRDLLIIYLWINKNVDEELMVNWLKDADDLQLLQMLTLAEMCLYEFKYNGKKTQPLVKSSSNRSHTMPVRMAPNLAVTTNNLYLISNSTVKRLDATKEESQESEDIVSFLLEANLATETGLIVLDLIGIVTNYLYLRLSENECDNDLMKKVFSMYLAFFEFKQSDKLLGHLFASLRLFIQKFATFLFAGSTEYIRRICPKLLKFCSSRLNSVRSDASILIYLLLRANFNHTKQTAITRMQLQLIISVSQLLGDTNINLINNSRFQESLSLINNYAITDKTVQKTKFSDLVKGLIRSIRKILMATMLMKEHENDPEKLLDLQHHLANSYRETSPALRRTWLISMSKQHTKNGNYSEAAHCLTHVCALEFEVLRAKNKELCGAKNFEPISVNIVRDELIFDDSTSALNKDIYSSTEQQFTEELLVKSMQNAISLFAKAERFEIIPELYRLLNPLYEKRRDYETLVEVHREISENYRKISNLQKSNKRFLGRFYKVGFYGREYFEDDSGLEFIYKEEKVTSLSEISQRLKDLYSKKHGAENIKLIQSEKEIDEYKDCDPKYGYIQITYVVPYNYELEEEKSRRTLFERVNNIDRFMFETAFCVSDESKSRSVKPEDQAKRRTIVTTAYQFPYVVKRIKVIGKQVQVLSPIEVAIDEMKARVRELQEVILCEQPDLKKLHLKLGGSISVQVNAGPLAYAKAFINEKYPVKLVYQLREIYNEFCEICDLGLQLNEKLIGQEQHEYHESLKKQYNEMLNKLTTLCADEWSMDEDRTDFKSTISNKSFKYFDYISNSNNA